MADYVVVGGGIIGMLTAFYLSDSSSDVVVYEKGATGSESSWAGGGILSPLYPWRYPSEVTLLAQWSQERYENLSLELFDLTGIDTEWTQSGLMMLGLDEDECSKAVNWANEFSYPLHLLGAKEIESRVQGVGHTIGTAVWMPEVAQIRNPRLSKALKGALMKKGVTLVEETPVKQIVTEAGKVTGVRLKQGTVKADNVVVCGGAWSAELLATAGFDIAITPVKGQMLLYKSKPGLLNHILMHDGYYLIPRRDGRILAGSTLEYVGFNKGTTTEARENLHQKALELFPPLVSCEIEMQWAGLRPGTTDGIPYIGEMPSCQGLYVNAGQFRNGVVTGLASARLMTDIILNEAPILDPGPYSPVK